MKKRVGFIGLGLMGNPMSKNILKAGFPLTVYNRTPAKTKELKSLGAEVAKSPKEVAEKSDVVITMITAPKDVEEVLFAKNGVTSAGKKDFIVIDMSTIGPLAVKKISKKLSQHSIKFIDAPVTGSTPKAISGELTIFIGGDQKTFEEVKDVLSAMGTNLQYMGPTGSGQAVKLVNNFLVAANTIALSEAITIADSMKLSREKVAEALKTASGFAPSMILIMPDYISNTYSAKFSLANLKKDVSLAVMEVKDTPFQLPILNHAKKTYDEGMKKNLGNENYSAVIKLLKKKII